MPISQKVRRDVMERDQGECQFWCGGQPATEISHFKHQGTGGLPVGHWKNQPSNLAVSCGECHDRLPPNGRWCWVEFQPVPIPCGVTLQDEAGKLKPEIVGVAHGDLMMKILDPDGNVVPKSDLWFYNRWRKQAAIMAARSLQTVATIDCTVGEMMHDLRDGAEFLAGKQTFEEYVSGLGWDSIKANHIADIYEWSQTLECGWPADVNYSKMGLLYGVDWGEHPAEPFARSAEGGDSYSTLQAALIKAGLKESQYRIYALVSVPFIGAVRVVYVRTRQEDELTQLALDRKCAVLKINALKGCLEYRRGRSGGLFVKKTGVTVGLLTLEEWAQAKEKEAEEQL